VIEICRSVLSVLMRNLYFLNYIYIYVYIYMCVCVCVCFKIQLWQGTFFDVSLTVHLSIISVIHQLNAQSLVIE